MEDTLTLEIKGRGIDKTTIILTLENMGYDVTEICSCIVKKGS